MTRKNILNKTKSRFIITLLTICLLCASLFVFTACETKENTSTTKPNYSYSETNDTLISNSYFAYGTADVKLTAYPKSSVTGWSKKAETDMSSSSSKYGVIDVSDEGWTNLLNKLYDDSYFLNFFKIKYDFEDSDVKTALGKANPSSNEIKEYVISNYFKSTSAFKYPEGTTAVNQFKNPGVHTGANDNKVYMLNNYLSKDNVGRGTAQKITSSTNITLNKGEFGKVSVWVKTQNVSGLGVDYGANIRLSNSFNSTSQADFGIYNITDTEWTKYTIYVKADEVYTTSFNLVLGLGADRFSATEGTVYFDDVEFEHLTAEEYKKAVESQSVVARAMNYDSNEAVKINASDLKSGSSVSPALYDMALNTYIANNASDYKKPLDISDANVLGNYTTSNKTTESGFISGDRFADTPATKSIKSLDKTAFPYAEKAIELSLSKSSYTLSFYKDNPIKVEAGNYVYVEFFLKNELNKLGATNVTVDIFDILGNTERKRAAVYSTSEVNDEWNKIGLVLKNNFETGTREFYFEIVVGPTDVAATDYAKDYASGKITLSQPTIATGLAKEFVDEDETIKTEYYDLYSLFSSTANATTALYAGSASDYSEIAEETESYSLTVAPSDKGVIESKPAIPNGYKGIVSNHFYITDAKDATTSINTSKTAGLINTKYLDNYDEATYGNVKAKLDGAYDLDNNIQPLMIYNATSTQYGYIGNSIAIASNAYAKFSVTLRVVDNAKAFVYLVDTAGAIKDVLTFEDFTVNADVYGNAVTNGTSLSGKDMKFAFEVTSSMMQEDGWLTVEFYLATGANSKNVRIEIWNGSRDASVSSTGHVFVKDIQSKSSSAFKEPSNSKAAWTESGTPLYEIGEKAFDELYVYKRALTETEKKFNGEQTDSSKLISYESKYVWGKNQSTVYAIFNTLDPVETDPYASTDEEETTKGGCTVETDPSTFWLSFSSILLGVALAAAIIMLIVKNAIRRRRANASDAKSHYKVTSRSRIVKKATEDEKEQKVEEPIVEEESEEESVEEPEEAQEEVSEEENQEEKSLDEYVYGDVQDFGEETKEKNSEVDSTDSKE